MKKTGFLTLAAVVMSIFLITSTTIAYDRAQAKNTMRQVAQNMKDLNAKAAAKDYYGTAEKFMEIAKIFKGLEKVTPLKGSKAEWDRIHASLISAAFNGIGACGAKSDAGIKKAVEEMIKLRNEGHKIFIP